MKVESSNHHKVHTIAASLIRHLLIAWLTAATTEWLLLPAGFSKLVYTDAEEHDRMIAFTSQMPHIVSNAFIKSPTALSHKGFSAGSYKDLTRVAWLNPQMWAELFLSNKDNILKELSGYIDSLEQYRKAIENSDYDTLVTLLDEGKKRKEEVDG